ncbi:ABC transporter ATP-binding protein, partial [Actinoplanes philippinensis]
DAPQVEDLGDGRLRVHGMDAPGIADLAASRRLRVHELVTENTSLEQLFLDLTADKAATP